MKVAVAKRYPKQYFSYCPCEGIVFAGFDAVYATETQIEAIESPGLFIGLMLSGRSTSIRVDGIGDIRIPAGRAILMGFSEKTRCTNFYRAGEFCAGVGLHIEFKSPHANLTEPFATAVSFLQEIFSGMTAIEVLPACPKLNALSERALQLPPDAPFRDLELDAILRNFLALICRMMEQHGEHPIKGNLTKRERNRVEVVTNHLRNHLEQTPSLTELSKLAGVNPSTLADNFKAAHGQTIFSFYRDLRLDTARTILRCESATVTEAGIRVGFSSPAAFATAYRRRFGHSPSQEMVEKT